MYIYTFIYICVRMSKLIAASKHTHMYVCQGMYVFDTCKWIGRIVCARFLLLSYWAVCLRR